MRATPRCVSCPRNAHPLRTRWLGQCSLSLHSPFLRRCRNSEAIKNGHASHAFPKGPRADLHVGVPGEVGSSTLQAWPASPGGRLLGPQAVECSLPPWLFPAGRWPLPWQPGGSCLPTPFLTAGQEEPALGRAGRASAVLTWDISRRDRGHCHCPLTLKEGVLQQEMNGFKCRAWRLPDGLSS